MTKIEKLHRTWIKDPAYRKEYDALEEELTVMAAIARRGGLSQANPAMAVRCAVPQASAIAARSAAG